MWQSYKECLYNTIQTKKLITSLGFIINNEKVTMTPSKILGFVLDSVNFQITLSAEEIDRVKKEIQRFFTLSKCKIREFAQFIGLLISICPAKDYSWLYTKHFECMMKL